MLRSVSARMRTPDLTSPTADSARLSRAARSTFPSPPSGNWMESLAEGNPASRILQRLLSSSSVMTGRSILISRACSGVSSRILGWLPMYVVRLMTSSSRMGSMGGLVTCANNCLK